VKVTTIYNKFLDYFSGILNQEKKEDGDITGNKVSFH
jgi:hypothetical protein